MRVIDVRRSLLAWFQRRMVRLVGVDAVEQRLSAAEQRARALEANFEDWHSQLSALATAVLRRATVDDLQRRADELHERIVVLTGMLPSASSGVPERQISPLREGRNGDSAVPASGDALMQAFYPALERQFRGTPAQIRDRLAVYRTHLMELPGKRVADLGCGRGEWLGLLDEWGFDPIGIDANPLNTDSLQASGHEVVCADVLAWLRLQPSASLAAVSAIHLVEHLPFAVLLDLLAQMRRVLAPGGLLLLETPDPENPFVAMQGFWFDPTHRHPLPAPLLEFAVSWSGLVPEPVLRLNPCAGDPENTCDYAVLARRPADRLSS